MARYGVPEYWNLDPLAKTVELSRLTAIGYEQPIVSRKGAARRPSLPASKSISPQCSLKGLRR